MDGISIFSDGPAAGTAALYIFQLSQNFSVQAVLPHKITFSN
jgi:hypothetical protein